MSRLDLRQALRDEGMAIAALARSRGGMSRHGPSLGRRREEVLTQFLRERFPWTHVTGGEIAAPDGSLSGEWDVILTDPRAGGPLAGVAGSQTVPIEAVLAVVSVKSRLLTDSIDECARGAAQLRGMRAQQTPTVPLPAVYALGFEGLKARALDKALAAASASHGDLARLDGILVLRERLALPDGDGYAISDNGEDAYGRWIVALSAALESTPRLRASLSDYLPDDEAPPSDGGSGVVLPDRPRPGGSLPGVEMDQAEAASAGGAQPTALRLDERLRAPDLSSSRTLGQLVTELRAEDPLAAERFGAALASMEMLRTLARDATGPLLRTAARALAALDEVDASVEALEHLAGEAGADRAEALAMAALVRLGAGQADRVATLLEASADEQHPAVRLVRAATMDDPDESLELLATIEPASAWQARVHGLLTATKLLDADRNEEAAETARAGLAELWSVPMVERLARALLRLDRSERGQGGPLREDAVVEEAAAALVEAGVEAHALGWIDEAMTLDASLVAALAILHRHDDVARLADWWATEGDLQARDVPARVAFASALLDAQRFSLAELIAPADADDSIPGRLLATRLDLRSDRPDVVARAVEALDAMLAEATAAGEDATPIAHARALAAVDHDAAWSTVAGDVMAGTSTFYRDQLHAEHLARSGDPKGAETLLLPYADSPSGVRALIDIAVTVRDWRKVVTLVDTGLGKQAPPVERLRRADALQQLGKVRDAEQAWQDLAEAEDTPAGLREHAWIRCTRSLGERQQWDELATTATAWWQTLPASPLAPWVAADAHMHAGRSADGLALLTEAGRRATSAPQRHLVAWLAVDVLPLAEALQTIVDLSDEVDRQDELLESMLITVSAGKDKEGLPKPLEARIRQTFADFATRFPESSVVQTVRAPTTDEEWEDFAERYLVRRQRWANQMMEDVARGTGALAMLALLGKSPLEVWLTSNMLPLAPPRADLIEQEISAADAAIAGGASWDGSVFAVWSLLPEQAAKAVARSLPASLLARAVLVEVESARALAVGVDLDDGPSTLAWDGERGHAVLYVEDPKAAAASAERLGRIAVLAGRITVADPDTAGDSQAAVALRDDSVHPSAKAWLGAAALAADKGIPFYSDDRYMRAWMRQQGVPTFGTVALIEALHRRSALDDRTRAEAMWDLRGAGGRHLPLRPGELARRVAQDGFRLTRPVDATLLDPDGWHAGPEAMLLPWQEALQAVWRHDPEHLSTWVGHLIGRLSSTIGQRPSVLAGTLLAPALMEPSPDVEFNRGLIAAMRRCEREILPVGDPVETVFGQLRRTPSNEGYAFDLYVQVRVLAALPMNERLRVLRRWERAATGRKRPA